jgi:hypothetical protein
MTASLYFSLLLPTLRSGFGFGRFSIRYAQLFTFNFCLAKLYGSDPFSIIKSPGAHAPGYVISPPWGLFPLLFADSF